MVIWGGSCRGGVGHVGVGWIMQRWGGVGDAGVDQQNKGPVMSSGWSYVMPMMSCDIT